MATMTEERKTYNGWANYETWAVALWIDNEEPLYRERVERAQYAWDASDIGDDDDHSSDARYRFAQDLKSWVRDELAPDLGASLWADLLGAALDEVDWDEIADNWLSEIDGYERRA